MVGIKSLDSERPIRIIHNHRLPNFNFHNNESLSCTNPTKYQPKRSTVRKNPVSWEANFHLPKGKPFHTKRLTGQKMMINKKISTNSELNTEMFHHPCSLSNGLKICLISKKKKKTPAQCLFFLGPFC